LRRRHISILIAGIQLLVVDEGQCPDAKIRKLLDHVRAEAANTDNCDVRASQSRLAVLTEEVDISMQAVHTVPRLSACDERPMDLRRLKSTSVAKTGSGVFASRTQASAHQSPTGPPHYRCERSAAQAPPHVRHKFRKAREIAY
jgi:hypothetical protein